MIIPALHPTDPHDVPHIRFHGWDVTIGHQHVLRELDFEVPRGRIVGLVGPTGAGKSTLLQSVNRLLADQPSVSIKGELLLDGDPIWGRFSDDLAIRRRTGSVFRNPDVLPGSILSNVIFPLKLDGITSRKVLEESAEKALRRALVWDELRDQLSQPARDLPRGLRASINLARALIGEPEVLLLDEPCALLDPMSTHRFEDALLDLSGRCTILISTHNLAQASRITQRLAFFLDGRLEEFGPTDQLFQKPLRTSTEDYLSGRYAS
jgi:phosphate transport system ATP-binding protein